MCSAVFVAGVFVGSQSNPATNNDQPDGAVTNEDYVPTTEDLEAMGLFPIGDDIRSSQVSSPDHLSPAVGPPGWEMMPQAGPSSSVSSDTSSNYIPTVDDLEAMGIFPIGDGLYSTSASTASALQGTELLPAAGEVSSSQVAAPHHLETIGLSPAFGVMGN